MSSAHLLQAVTQQVNTAPSGNAVSLGAWLGIIATIASVLGVAYKLGANDANTKNVKSSVEATLKEVNQKLDTFTAFIRDTLEERIRLADWKGSIAGRVDAIDTQTEDNRNSVHRARNVAAEAYALAERADSKTQQIEERVTRIEKERADERRHGPKDRRHDENDT